MNIKKNAKRTNHQIFPQGDDEQQSEKRNYLILSGVLLAITSIGVLIFVLSEKVFHLNYI